MPKQIFRKVALEKMSSPEQLDQMITITTPLGWLSLLVIGGLLLSAILWGIYGSIPTKVQGQGIILRQGGVVGVQTLASGEITEIRVAVGDVIERGQSIARLRQDELLEQIEKAQLRLKGLETLSQEKNEYQEEALNIQLQELQQDQVALQHHIKDLEIQINTQYTLKKQQQKFKEQYQNLVKEGIIPKNKVLEVENEIIKIEQTINTLKLEVEKAKNQFNDILLSIKNVTSTKTLDELTRTEEIEQVKLEIKDLEHGLARSSQVVSRYSGRVLEVSVSEGELVSAGRALLLIENTAEESELEVITYFSPLTGKQIEKGMKAQIAPTIVKREEFGFMEGIVSEVDEYPSTLQAVIQTLENQTLAHTLAADTAPIKVVVSLIPDANTESRYKWSSAKGPSMRMSSGTVCFAEVTVKEQAPITLVIPVLKKFLFGAENP